MTYQRRLPFPRKRTPITCGHPYANHAGHGMCEACYARDYRTNHLEARLLAEAKNKAKRAAAQKEKRRERDERLEGAGIRRAGQAVPEG
jgi:hypothetical protein